MLRQYYYHVTAMMLRGRKAAVEARMPRAALMA